MSEVAQAIHSSPDGHIPQLRFPEFSGEWMTDELSNLIEISSNKFNPNTSNESKKCIELEHLSQETGELLGYTDSTAQASTKNAFTKGQVLFGKLRPYLKKFWLSQFDGVCSSEIWVLNGKKLANNYLFQFIQTNKFNQIANVSSGSKMPRSDWKYMVQVPFKYTTKPEQQKIAAFLTAVDNKIEQLSKKQALLGEYKKGLMQKIFSQAIRFKADDGSDFPDWEDGLLNTLIDNSRKIRYGIVQPGKYDKNGKYLIRGKDYSNGWEIPSEFFKVSDAIEKKYSKTRVKKGDVIVCIVGSVGNVMVIPGWLDGANITQTTARIAPDKNKLNNQYLYFYFQSLVGRNMIHKHTRVGTRPGLNIEDVEKFSILLPSLLEQAKIANFLSSIDNKIEQVGKQLDESKQFKKALLQQMFV